MGMGSSWVFQVWVGWRNYCLSKGASTKGGGGNFKDEVRRMMADQVRENRRTKKDPGVTSGVFELFLDQEILEDEAETGAGKSLVETVVAVEVTGISEETDAAVDAVLESDANVAVALRLSAPGCTTANEGVRSKVKALNWETSDQVALSAVVGVAVAVEAGEGVIDADTEVLREEVAEAETAAEAVDGSAIVVTGCTGREGVKLDFTGAEEILLGSHDDFLGGLTGERGRCSGQNDCD
jgi:hypothetical protein